MPIYYVRCTAASTVNYRVSVWDSNTAPNAKPIPDPLIVTSAALIEFAVDYGNSDNSMQNFVMRVNPDKPKNITVTGDGTKDIKIYDACPVAEDIKLRLTVWQDDNGYATDSGKPIIRNRPARQPVQWVPVATAVLIAVAAVIAIAHYGFGVDFGFGRAP